MHLKSTRFRLAPLAIVAALAISVSAWAQGGYPSRPVRIIVAFPPGGINDVHARTVGERLSARLGQPVLVENRSGAGGRIGMETAARAPADGYTLVVMNSAVNAIIPAAFRDVPYDTLRDFQPVAKVVVACPMIVVHPSVPARSLSEFIEHARANPGRINFGTPGAGNGAHISGEQLMAATGIKMTHVPYRGEGPMLNDLIAGHVQLTFAAAVAPFVASGQARALATVCRNRSVAFPDVPTVLEAGYPALVSEGWQGIGAPAGTPREIVQQLAEALREIAADPAVREKLAGSGLAVDYLGTAEFQALIADEISRWKRVIADLHITVE